MRLPRLWPFLSSLRLRSCHLPFSSPDSRSIFRAFGGPGDTHAFVVWLVQALTLAAFGEEMVFRGYLIRRVIDLTGDTGIGRVVAVAASSALFGLAHRYQGSAGVVATGIIGAFLGALYLFGRKNLWPVIVCHGIVDAVILSALYLGHRSLLFP